MPKVYIIARLDKTQAIDPFGQNRIATFGTDYQLAAKVFRLAKRGQRIWHHPIMRQIRRIVDAMLMFQLAKQAKSVDYLHDQEMEGIDMKTFGALMGAGELTLADYDGQVMYGKALLNEAVYYMRTPRFKA